MKFRYVDDQLTAPSRPIKFRYVDETPTNQLAQPTPATPTPSQFKYQPIMPSPIDTLTQQVRMPEGYDEQAEAEAMEQQELSQFRQMYDPANWPKIEQLKKRGYTMDEISRFMQSDIEQKADKTVKQEQQQAKQQQSTVQQKQKQTETLQAQAAKALIAEYKTMKPGKEKNNLREIIKGFSGAIVDEAQQKPVEAEQQMQTEQLENVYSGLRGLESGLTFGASNIAAKYGEQKIAGERMAPSTTTGKILESGGALVGGIATGKGIADVIKARLPAGMSVLAANAATRIGTAAIQGAANAASNVIAGNKTAKEAAADVGQNVASTVLSMAAELAIPSGSKAMKVANAVGQVVTDLAADVGFGKLRGQDIASSDWWINELPQLATSAAFALRDATEANFEATRKAQVRQLKDSFKASEPTPIKPTRTPAQQKAYDESLRQQREMETTSALPKREPVVLKSLADLPEVKPAQQEAEYAVTQRKEPEISQGKYTEADVGRIQTGTGGGYRSSEGGQKPQEVAKPDIDKALSENIYTKMPIERVREDAGKGVRLAQEALSLREPTEMAPEAEKPVVEPAEAPSKTAAEATKITITRSNGVGVLTKAQDGRWDITLNGTKAPGNNYYDNTQVDRIVSKAIADGANVEVERKQVDAIQREVLKQSGIPDSKKADYVLDTVADGEALRKTSEAVAKGDMTVEQAAEKITADFETKGKLTPETKPQQETQPEPVKPQSTDDLSRLRQIAVDQAKASGVKPEDAEDLAQDILVSFSKNYKPQEGKGPENYIRAATKRKAFTYKQQYAKEAQTKTSMQEDAGEGRTVEEGIKATTETPTEDAVYSEVRQAVAKLPENQRRVVELRNEGYTYEEVGKELGLSRAQVTRLEKAGRAALRVSLSDIASESGRRKRGGFIQFSDSILGNAARRIKGLFSPSRNLGKETWNAVSDLKDKVSSVVYEAESDRRTISDIRKIAKKSGASPEEITGDLQELVAGTRKITVDGNTYTETEIEDMPFRDAYKIAKQAGLDMKEASSKNEVVDALFLSATRPDVDSFASKYRLDTRTTQRLIDIQDKRVKSAKDLSEALKKAGVNKELVDVVGSNEYYLTRMYEKYILGDDFVPSKMAKENAVDKLQQVFSERITRTEKRAGELSKAGVQIKQYFETGDKRLLEGYDEDTQRRAMELGTEYYRLRRLLSSIEESGDTVLLLENSEAIRNAAESEIDFYLKRGTSGGGEKSTGTFNIDNLAKRELGPVFRALYGEITDPAYTLAKSTEVQGKLLAQHAFLDRLFQEGEGKLWGDALDNKRGFTELLGVSSPGQTPSQDAIRKYGRLAGKAVTPEMKMFFDGEKNIASGLSKLIGNATALQRIVKVTGNPKSWARDYTSNYMMALQAGDPFRPGYATHLAHAHKLITRLMAGDADAYREMARLASIGVFRNDMNSITDDLRGRLGGIGKPVTKFMDFWQGAANKRAYLDFFTKYAAFKSVEAETGSQEKAKQHVRRFYQNRDLVPDVVRKFARIPFVSPDYINFKYDSVRMEYEAVKNLVELAKAGDKNQFAKTAAGFAAARAWGLIGTAAKMGKYGAIGAAAWTTIQRALRRDDEETVESKLITDQTREKALRNFMQSFDANEVMVAWDETMKDGSKRTYYTVFGNNAVTPFALDEAIFGALQTGWGDPKKMAKSMGETLSRQLWDFPMMSQTLSKGLFGVTLGERGTYDKKGILDVLGKEDWKKNSIVLDSIITTGADVGGGALSDLLFAESRIAKKQERMGLESPDKDTGPFKTTETPSDLRFRRLGLYRTYRIEKSDFKERVRQKVKTYEKQFDETKAAINRAEETPTQDALRLATEAKSARVMLFNKLADDVKYAKAFWPTLTDDDMMEILARANISKADAKAVLDNDLEAINEPTKKRSTSFTTRLNTRLKL